MHACSRRAAASPAMLPSITGTARSSRRPTVQRKRRARRASRHHQLAEHRARRPQVHCARYAGSLGFSMVRMSATTHTTNTDQRFLRPEVSETSSGTYELDLDDNVNVLVPGYWMVFAMKRQRALDREGPPDRAHGDAARPADRQPPHRPRRAGLVPGRGRGPRRQPRSPSPRAAFRPGSRSTPHGRRPGHCDAGRRVRRDDHRQRRNRERSHRVSVGRVGCAERGRHCRGEPERRRTSGVSSSSLTSSRAPSS